jgi:hypothetical protein
MRKILAKQGVILGTLFYAPNPLTNPPPTNYAPFTKCKGAKVGIQRTHKAKVKFNPRNTKWTQLLGARI